MRLLPRVVLAGTHSSVGKTTVAIGVMAALRRRGVAVAPFKAGPDYIDPSLHTLAAGRPSRNLDSWLLSEAALLGVLGRGMQSASVAVIEGVMGLFDGIGSSQVGSTAALARSLDCPVVLVLDVAAMSTTAAALVLGCQRMQPGVRLAGVVLNRVGSAGHLEATAEAIRQATGLPTLGSLPGDARLAIPERHLGLIPAGEGGLSQQVLDDLAALVEERFDLQGILRLAAAAPPVALGGSAASGGDVAGWVAQAQASDWGGVAAGEGRASSPGEGSVDRARAADMGLEPGMAERSVRNVAERSVPVEVARDGGRAGRPVRVGVARDRAFGFYYADTFDLLAELGAEVVPFSPLGDAHLPPGLDGVYLGGGFPELYARELAANASLRADLHQLARSGRPIYAECGGLMALGRDLITLEGERFDGFGLLPLRSRMRKASLTIGYREVEALRDSALLRRGEHARGHEFHWSEAEEPPADLAAYRILPAGPREGYAVGSVLGSYVHLNFAGTPHLLARFVRRMAVVGESPSASAS